MIGIYKITNNINGKFYIGKSNNIKRRFGEHRAPNHETNFNLKRAFKKYGLENFTFEIICECSIDELNEKEMYYIKELKPQYNCTDGGDGALGHHLSEELKEILRKKGKEQWARMSEEQKQKVIKNNLIGPKEKYIMSDETKQKLRIANLGKKQSKETIEKRKETIRIKKANGYVITNGNHKKPIMCIETGEKFDSLKEAEQKYNLSTLCGHLKGKYKTCKGLHYKYCSVTTNCDECSSVE